MKERGNQSIRDGIAAVVTVILLVAVLRPVLSGGTDRNRACVNNAGNIGTGLGMYVQDYDERFPPQVENTPQFEQLLKPYVGPDIHYKLRCPATRNTPFILNAALSGQPTAAFGDDATIEVLRDAKPHPDGKTMVSFLDGHVERDGVDQADPEVECPSRVGKLNIGLLMYAQDYDERLPIFSSDEEVEALLYSYVQSHRPFDCPATLLPYHFNPTISGQPLASFPNPAAVETLRDPKAHKNGKVTIAYLDGTVTRGGQAANGIEEGLRRARQLAIGVRAYIQDNNGSLPPITDYAAFEAAIFPYVGSSRPFTYPGTNQGYVLNAALDGHNFADFADPSQVMLLHAPVVDTDGKMTVVYLDRHAVRITP